MKSLLLAAGEGTRLRPLTLDRPKPMGTIGDRPLLAITVDQLRRHGIGDLAINLHYRPEAITGYFGDGMAFGVRITYSHEPALLDTAGAAKKLVCEPAIFGYIQPATFYDFGHQVLLALLAAGEPVYGLPLAADEYLIDIGSPEKYARAQREWPAARRSREARPDDR